MDHNELRAISATSDNLSTMQLAALNIDVLLHLLEFVDPIDRFNLILSGILKGFDNVSKGMDLRKR